MPNARITQMPSSAIGVQKKATALRNVQHIQSEATNMTMFTAAQRLRADKATLYKRGDGCNAAVSEWNQ